MATAQAEGCVLEYDVMGQESGAPLLLIQGLGDQLTKWSDGFHHALVARGLRVIRFDNRDVGLSTHLDVEPVPDLAEVQTALVEGRTPDVPYHLEDMAADAVAVLDAVGVESAHIVGASMGGMIAQLVAADHPDRTRTLTSIMSSTGNPAAPQAMPEVIGALISPAPHPTDEPAYLTHAVRVARLLGSPAFPEDESVLRANLLAAVRRSHDPAGFGRQVAALVANGDRRDRLRALEVPTLVIHGIDDPLLPVECGRETAAMVPGARLLTIPGMGHNLPAALYDRIADAIADHIRQPV